MTHLLTFIGAAFSLWCTYRFGYDRGQREQVAQQQLIDDTERWSREARAFWQKR